MQRVLFLFLLLISTLSSSAKLQTLTLKNEKLNLQWTKTQNGWQLSKIEGVINSNKYISFGKPSGEYTLLFSQQKPDCAKAVSIVENDDTITVLDKNFTHGTRALVSQRATSSVPMNRAGEANHFFPSKAKKNADGITFESNMRFGKYIAHYSLDDKNRNDILLSIKFTASHDGYYSLASPSLAAIHEKDLRWGIVPGYFQGNSIQPNLTLAYTYAQGLPRYPILCRENTITSLCSIISSKSGLTLGVIPDAGQDRNPYSDSKNEHNILWKVALSHMNRKSELSPTAYHPVLGEDGSYVKKNETITFNLRYTLQNTDWYSVYKHAIYDVYQLKKTLKLKQTKQSLSERLLSLYEYVCNDSTSKWRVANFENNLKIGAQDYAGGVKGSDKDAMKNSDVGAVWMLAKATNDKKIIYERLPFIRNFKCAQQQTGSGFFEGAARGQYYLYKSQTFTEEWGNHFEPIGLTYYTLTDLGNILLFYPMDKELRELLQLGADRLLTWQKSDGSFEVAYEKSTEKPIYTDLKDLRPTFYGLLVAYRILGNKKYLDAAEKGAKWFIENAVNKGHFLGVCGDYRFVNDFATGQSAQVLLDLYDISRKKCYLDAAIATARMYTTSIYTHPVPTTEDRTVGGKTWKDWQLSQVGLSFEHGGSMGSAVIHGPILLASHAGMFVRMFAITGDSLFLDLARAGVLGRDAFVHPTNRVASYYWAGFDKGAGAFPQHAWWQIGWITDYLISEAEMRTTGKVLFPRGFCTPKVGAHQTLGFTSGKVNGFPVDLVIRKNLVQFSNPNIDYIAGQTLDKKKLFVIVLNSQDRSCDVKVSINFSAIDIENNKNETMFVKLKPFDVKIIECLLNK